MCQLLLDAGANSDARTDVGDNALHIAAMNGHIGCCTVLLGGNNGGGNGHSSYSCIDIHSKGHVRGYRYIPVDVDIELELYMYMYLYIYILIYTFYL